MLARCLVAVACMVRMPGAGAQILWLTSERPQEPQHRLSSHLGTWAEARGRQSHQLTCSFSSAHAPVPLTAWFKQFERCDPVTLPVDHATRFQEQSPAEAVFTDATGRRSVMQAEATQLADLQPGVLRVSATAVTRHTGPEWVGNRGTPRAWGEVYFRVPEGPRVRLNFRGSLRWEGKASAYNGGFQVLWRPNTISDPRATLPNFGWIASNADRTQTSGTVVQQNVYLSPGVYMITWHVHADVTDADSLVVLEIAADFVDEELCQDTFDASTPRWPSGSGYTATIVREEPTGQTRYTPHCDNHPGACWKQSRVRFHIRKGDRETGPHFGWKYLPGTLRRDRDYLRCPDIDPRYNCHGLTFAQSRFWLEDDSLRQILVQWCPREIRAADAQPGDVRVYFSAAGLPPIFDWLGSAVQQEPSHSQTLLQRPGEIDPRQRIVDEKAGLLRYSPEIKIDGWDRGTARYFRCDF